MAPQDLGIPRVHPFCEIISILQNEETIKGITELVIFQGFKQHLNTTL